MKNRIKQFAAGALLCLLLSGCDADRALVFEVAGDGAAVSEGREEAGPGSEERPEERGEAEGMPGSPADPDRICVYVCGAVKSPQVVLLPAGSRGYQAVEAAGGFAEDAASDAVNLAESLEDGERFFIPTREEAEGMAAEKGASESGVVNINQADAARLCTLPGIGKAKAEAIIAYRESNGGFRVPEDIMKVPGIKEGAFEKIKDKISVK